jgi:hypothetical protein
MHDRSGKSVQSAKNAAAVALGRLGGLKGGHARAAKLSSRRRSQIAAKAARMRWRMANEVDKEPTKPGKPIDEQKKPLKPRDPKVAEKCPKVAGKPSSS